MTNEQPEGPYKVEGEAGWWGITSETVAHPARSFGNRREAEAYVKHLNAAYAAGLAAGVEQERARIQHSIDKLPFLSGVLLGKP